MNNKLNSRKDKVNFLKGLQSGTTSIESILPMQYELWYQHDHEPDSYVNEKTGEVITEQQMQERKAINKNKLHFITVL